MRTFGGGGGAESAGEAWPVVFWAGLVPLWLLLLWSSGFSGAGRGLGWADADAVFLLSADGVFSSDVSVGTEGGDERREPSASAAATMTFLSPDSTFPLAEPMLSMSPKRQSGW